MMVFRCLFSLLIVHLSLAIFSWKELDDRPLPNWYDDAKFGIFLHWGIFSVPAYGSEWFQEYWQGWKNQDYQSFVNRTERANFAYQDYAHRFLAELYDPNYWASVFSQSGAQYVVLTSKHHEGYCMWDSSDVPSTWNWNVMDVGPRRDLLGDLSKAVKSTASLVTGSKIKFGVYHSLFEWFNPLYRQDKKNNWTTNYFVEMKAIAELYDLVAKYEPEIIWSDGEWEAPSSYWQARKFLSWYGYNSSVAKTAVWNDRWGTDTQCKHGSFLTCSDRYDPGHFVARKWENALTIDKTSWGYNRNATLDQYMSVKDLVHELIKVVAFNGNMLLNVGPGSDGTLGPIFVDRLLGLGEWLKINGGAIYGTRPWLVCQNETSSSTFYTRKENKLFAHFTEWPSDSILHLDYPIPTGTTEIRMLGLDGLIGSWKINSRQRTLSGITIELPRLTPANIPCDHAWVLEMTNIANVIDAHEKALKQHSNVE